MNGPTTMYTGPLGSTVHILRADAGTVADLAAEPPRETRGGSPRWRMPRIVPPSTGRWVNTRLERPFQARSSMRSWRGFRPCVRGDGTAG